MITHLVKDRFGRPLSREVPVRLRPVFEDFHLLRMGGDYEYPRHRHTNHEVILVESGPYRCELNGSELELRHGEALIIKPGDWHQDHLRNGQRHYVVHFRLETTGAGQAPPLFLPEVHPSRQIVGGNHIANAALLDELKLEAEAQKDHAGAIQDCLLEAFFWRLVRALDPKALSSQIRRLHREEATREALMLAIDRLSEGPASIGVLAAAMNMSVRKLNTICHAFLRRTPARALLEARLQRAEDLIRYQGLSIKEASDSLGFANPFHFSRIYRRLRGSSPSILKRQQRRTAPS
ncbi:MAG: helix-turn-helix transcriptional regulator [Opitutaceae bacterium]